MTDETGPVGWIPEESAKEAISDIVDSFIMAIDRHVTDDEVASAIKQTAEWEILRRTFMAMLAPARNAQNNVYDEFGQGLS